MIHHTKRPVKLYNTLVHDDTPRPKKGETVHPVVTEEQVRRMNTIAARDWAMEERSRLECLSTVQLRHLAKKEHISVPKYGKGARKVFITNIIRHRAKEQGIRLD